MGENGEISAHACDLSIAIADLPIWSSSSNPTSWEKGLELLTMQSLLEMQSFFGHCPADLQPVFCWVWTSQLFLLSSAASVIEVINSLKLTDSLGVASSRLELWLFRISLRKIIYLALLLLRGCKSQQRLLSFRERQFRRVAIWKLGAVLIPPLHPRSYKRFVGKITTLEPGFNGQNMLLNSRGKRKHFRRLLWKDLCGPMCTQSADFLKNEARETN